MEYTAGQGKKAEVWVDSDLLVVCDGLSQSDAPCTPGQLDGVKLSYMSAEGVSWDQAAKGNPGKRKCLESTNGWSYDGYGQVVSIMPVVIDFGVMQMEDANWTNDEQLVGRYVKIAVDRLEIVPATKPDWPEGIA